MWGVIEMQNAMMEAASYKSMDCDIGFCDRCTDLDCTCDCHKED